MLSGPMHGSVLVTGAAGFIGYHLARRLVDLGVSVVGIDSLNDYYAPSLKSARLAELLSKPSFSFRRVDISDARELSAVFEVSEFSAVVHLAGQAGVRHSLRDPSSYVQSNLVGFANLLEECRHASIGHLMYASSSSVYGEVGERPSSLDDPAIHPVSLYAATKRSNELLAHSYSHLFTIPTTGLRFFTVYGPWGRPDMAYWSFARKIIAGQPLHLYNHGRVRRDFTYVDDVVEVLIRLIPTIPAAGDVGSGGSSATAPWRVLNVGNEQPVAVCELIRALEDEIGVPARVEHVPMQPGDVTSTCADASALTGLIGPFPHTPLNRGIAEFVGWLRSCDPRSLQAWR